MANEISIKITADSKQAVSDIDRIKAKLSAIAPAIKPATAAVDDLSKRLKTLSASAKLDNARDIIGVQSLRTGQREIQRVEAAYQRLKTSGKLSAQELGAAFLATQTRLADLRSGMSGIGAAFERISGSVMALAGQFAVFGLAAREAITFESALVDLQRAAGISSAEAGEMGERFQTLGAELGMSATAVTALATSAAKAGVAVADLEEFSRVTATAAMNFDMMPEEAGDALAKLKNVLGLGVKDMEAFAGALNELADSASASEREIIEALKLGGSSGKSFGLTAKETSALATSFITMGASAEQAGTAMRTMLQRLRLATSGTGAAGKALQSVVGDTKQFAKAIAVDAKGALTQFLGSLEKLSSGQRLNVLRDIFGEGLDTENIGKLAGDVDQLTEALGHATKSDDELVKSLRELTALKLGTTQAEINRLGVAWRNAGEAVGKLFLPVIRAATIALSAMARAIETLAETFPALSRLAALVALVAAAWAPLKIAWGAMLILGGRISTLFTGMRAAGVGLLTAVRAGTMSFAAMRVAMGGMLGPIGLAITALSLLWDAWGWFQDSATDPLAKQKQALSGVSDALRTLGAGAQAAGDQIQASMDAATAPIEALKNDYKASTDSIVSELSRKQQAIDHQAQLEMLVVGRSNLSQRDAINATAGVMIRAEQAKTAAANTAGRQMEDTWQRTYGQALAIERAAGIEGSNLAQEAMDAKLAIYRQQETAYQSTVDRLIAEEKRLTQQIKSNEEERMLLRMSVQDRIRALQQRAMTDAQAYADRNRQIEQKLSQATSAKAKGEFDQAKRLTEDAMRLAESNARAVTQTVTQNGKQITKEVVSEAQASATAIGQLSRAAQIADQNMGSHTKTLASDLGKIGPALQEPISKLQQLKQSIADITGQQNKAIALQLEVDSKAAQQSVEDLKKYAEANAVYVEFHAKLDKAEKAVNAFKAEPENTKLEIAAEVALQSVEKSVAGVQATMEKAGLQIPAELNSDELTEKINELRSQIQEPTESKHTIVDNIKDVLRRLMGLDGKKTSSTHTVYVNEVTKKAAGGLVQRFAAGGQALRRMVGRISGPGTGTSDSVPAMLSNGEYVIRASSVRKYGAGLLDQINSGMYGQTSAPAQSPKEMRLTIAGPQGTTARVSTSRDEAQKLVKLLTSAGVRLA